jgi:hypothetical protein
MVGTAVVTFALVCAKSTRRHITRSLGIHAHGGTWRLVAILLALINLKNLPLVWHVGSTPFMKKR